MVLTKLEADKILDIYGRIRQRAPFLLRRPLGYFFYITARCNLNCAYCWQREKIQPQHSEIGKMGDNELSAEEWIRVIDSIPRPSFVGLSGGEPLLHNGFMQIIQHLAGRLPYTVNTNGILLDERILTGLIKYKAANLSISLDGFADCHDAAREKPGLFSHITEKVKCLNSLKKSMYSNKPSLTIKTVLLDNNIDHLIKFYKFCDETLKADCLNVSLMKTTKHAQFDFRIYENLKKVRDVGEPLCYEYSQQNKTAEILANLLDSSRNRRCRVTLYPKMYSQPEIRLLFKTRGKGISSPCYIPWSQIVILPDGNIIPCLSVKTANIRDLGYNVRQIDRLKSYKQFLDWRQVANRDQDPPVECNMCCFSEVKRH